MTCPPDWSVHRLIPVLLQGIPSTSTAITVKLYSANFVRLFNSQNLFADEMILYFPPRPPIFFASTIK